ncbi:MAG: hypothetical protein ACRDZO_17980, partial [Egibacteraceae bacterium]
MRIGCTSPGLSDFCLKSGGVSQHFPAQYGEVLHQTGVFHPNGAAHRPVCRILILQRFVNGASRHELL